MNALFWLIRKDLWRFLADRRGAALTVAVPVMIASLLGVIFAPSSRPRELSLLLVDEDQSPRVRALVARIEADSSLLVTELSREEAHQRIARGRAALAVILPVGSGEALQPSALFDGQTRPAVELLVDPSRSAEAGLVQGLLTQLMMEQIGQSFTSPSTMRELFDGLRADLEAETVPGDSLAWTGFLDSGRALADSLEAAGGAEANEGPGLQPPLRFERQEVVAAGPAQGFHSHAHNFSGMLCMFLLFWGQQAATEFLRERAGGTLTRLRLAPFPAWQILVGRGLSAGLLSVLISAAVFGCGIVLFGIPIRGPLVGFLAVIFAQALFIGGFAMMLAGLARSEAQLAGIGTLVILLLSFTGGAWLPSFLLPSWLRQIARCLPTIWATEGLAAMTWRGLGAGDALLPVGVLSLWGIGCALVGLRSAPLRPT